ncbi:hypothetical protein HPB49_010487 [Dermacentor silvarum]|uniref:Uncharacterized protein n=1 Tax=Dermacentor silvarum TaxID=543639 RepID=A0ACB8CEF4_DERSI|nr:hypothetical protein HPB49_010487 [Dermacentor silvarum]
MRSFRCCRTPHRRMPRPTTRQVRRRRATCPTRRWARASHECTPKCSLCGGAHATGDRTCTAKYRPLQPKRSDSTPKRTKHRRKRGDRRPRQPKNPGDPQDRCASQQLGHSQDRFKPAASSTDTLEKRPAASGSVHPVRHSADVGERSPPGLTGERQGHGSPLSYLNPAQI